MTRNVDAIRRGGGDTLDFSVDKEGLQTQIEKMSDNAVWEEYKKYEKMFHQYFGDVTEEFNDDAQDAREKGYIDENGIITLVGARYIILQEKLKQHDRDVEHFAKQVERETRESKANRTHQEHLKTTLKKILQKYDFDGDISVRTTEDGYVLLLKTRVGGNGRPEVIKKIVVDDSRMLAEALEQHFEQGT